jgi:hypothetical protein
MSISTPHIPSTSDVNLRVTMPGSIPSRVRERRLSTQRLRLVATRVVLVGALVVGIAACGDDDDAAASGAYCDDLVAFNAAAMQTDLNPESTSEEIAATSAVIAPRWEAVRASAPTELRDELAPVSAAIEALEGGDAEPFNADETFMQYTVLVSNSLEVCDFETISVEAGDYWFEGIPDDMSAGTVAVRFTNSAESEMHEFVVFRKHDPTQAALDILDMMEEDDEAVTFIGAAFAPAGETSAGLMEFEAGSYFAVCFIPIGGVEGGAPHFTAGQITEFSVS